MTKPLLNKTSASPYITAEGQKHLSKELFKAAKAKEVKEKEGDLAKEFGEAMVQAFSSLFSGMMEIGENSVILQIKDPESKVAAIEFTDKNGKRIKIWVR